MNEYYTCRVVMHMRDSPGYSRGEEEVGRNEKSSAITLKSFVMSLKAIWACRLVLFRIEYLIKRVIIARIPDSTIPTSTRFSPGLLQSRKAN